MKKSLIGVAGISLLGVLAFGAVKTYVVDPKTISSASELLSIFFEARESLPPLPSPVSYEEVINQLAEERMDFVAHKTWAYVHEAGTYYLSDKSKLARELKLPMHLVAYEDLLSGTVMLVGTSDGSDELQILAKVAAPDFSPYDEKVSLESYLMWELGPRRMIWTATLKSEADAWADLAKAEEASAAALSAAPMMMSMSAPAVVTNIQLTIESTGNGTVEVEAYWPVDFTNRLEIYAASDLVTADWQIAQTEISTTGGSSYAWEDTNTNLTQRMYAAGNMDIDTDGDGIPDAREKYLYKTDPDLADTDGDGVDDGAEIANGTDPLQADSDGDGLHDGIEDALAASTQTNGTDGVLVIVPGAGWYHATAPNTAFVYLGSE